MTHNIAEATQPAAALILLDRVRDRIRLKHYSKHTELAYLG